MYVDLGDCEVFVSMRRLFWRRIEGKGERVWCVREELMEV